MRGQGEGFDFPAEQTISLIRPFGAPSPNRRRKFLGFAVFVRGDVSFKNQNKGETYGSVAEPFLIFPLGL